MIILKQKSDCCGCEVCMHVCPQKCITLKEDIEGYKYPYIDKESCIDCNLCSKRCPLINSYESRFPLKIMAAKSTNKNTQIKSSSGGIFSELATLVLQKNGIVFGVKFDTGWEVVHSYIDNIDDLWQFQTSKYVQSNIADSYQRAKEFLEQNRIVLFSGTPCQIAGLKRFLNREYDHLYCVDFVCHGVPSPKVWQQYLAAICNKQNIKFSSIQNINFRDKTEGWNSYSFSIKYFNSKKENKVFREPLYKNLYLQSFIANITLRPSCYSCAFKRYKSMSDITMGDYWGIEKEHPNFKDNNGISLMSILTDKGLNIYRQLHISDIESSYDKVKTLNSAIECPCSEPSCRTAFMDKLDSENILSLMSSYLKTPFRLKVHYMLIPLIKRLKTVLDKN